MTTREEVKKALALVQCRMVVTPEEDHARVLSAKRSLGNAIRTLERLLGADDTPLTEKDQARLGEALEQLHRAVHELDELEPAAGPYLITAPPIRAAMLNEPPTEEPSR